MSRQQSRSSRSRYPLRELSTAQGTGAIPPAPAPPATATPSSVVEEDRFSLNYIFFIPSEDTVDVSFIDFTKVQFQEQSGRIHSAFVTKIYEDYKRTVEATTLLKFWKPIEYIDIDTAADIASEEWERKLLNWKEYFTRPQNEGSTASPQHLAVV